MQTKKESSYSWRMSYHEAGHAVMVRILFGKAAIRHVAHEFFQGEVALNEPYNSACCDLVRMVTSMAGSASEEVYAAKYLTEGCSLEEMRCKDQELLDLIVKDNRLTLEYVSALWDSVRDWVGRPVVKHAIDELAEMLSDKLYRRI